MNHVRTARHGSVATILYICASLVGLSTRAFGAPDDGLGMGVMGARIDSDGTILSTSGVTGVTRIGNGQYRVDFDRDVSQCFYSVNLFSLRASSVQPTVSVANSVTATVWGLSGVSFAPEDGQFYIIAYCAK